MFRFTQSSHELRLGLFLLNLGYFNIITDLILVRYMQSRLPGQPYSLELFKELAPNFSNCLGRLSELGIDSPEPIDLPSCLNLQTPKFFKTKEGWLNYLSSTHVDGITVRELYLRVLLVYAVSDQGADIPGVRLFMNYFISQCYSQGKFLFHEQQIIGDQLIIKAADEGAKLAFKERSEIWAQTGKRSASTYSVFTVDSVRGKPSANWYVNSRIAPPLSIPFQISGGLTSLLLNCKNRDEVKEVLRQDTLHGLFYAIGDKALDLYVKWIYGTFGLFIGIGGMAPRDVPVPMDQRIGKVLMRCGFMDELFDLKKCILDGRFLLKGPGKGKADLVDGNPPQDRVFLRVTDFRRHGRIRDDELVPVLNHYRSSVFSGKTLPPQIAINTILELFRATSSISILPHQFDDLLMHVAEFCHDREPDCEKCPLRNQCQANKISEKSFLKEYYT
jgi:hypothetical protein